MYILDIHEDIIQTHILTKVNGQTLANMACTSSHLQSLCSNQKLWSNICSSNWPSTNHPLITRSIANHRSLFGDSFPSPSHHLTTATSSPPIDKIISAVDLKYHDQVVLSKAVSTNTTPTKWFQTSPFRVDLVEPKEIIPSCVKVTVNERVMQSNLESNMTLSWIMIDPIQKRAVNLSSIKPVFVQKNWLTEEIELSFCIVIDTDKSYVNCNIEVTCGVNEGSEELYVSGVSLTIQDMDGKCLSGKGSLVILQGLMAAARRCNGGGKVMKERYDEFIQKRNERKEMMERRERRLDLACVASGLTFLMVFWSFALY
ncbi:F-box protein At2g27310-like [Rutidosis leptorrhynchoides]|uniref:F-box protein At2g27310-like n=1 Tax=Rutidosis leptorrhynchoides TaxID=125765 RepID=UPI003A98EE52